VIDPAAVPHADGDPPIRRVTIAASSFAPHKGGVEELVAQLAEQQRSEGGEPRVFTMRWPKDLPAAETIAGIPVRRFLYRAPEGRPRQRLLARATRSRTVAAIATELRQARAELVHIQCVSSGAWFVEQATRQVGLPLVVTLQGELTMDATGVYDRSPFLRATLRHLLETADAVTACSRATLEEAEAWAQTDLGARGSVVYNGVRLADFDRVEATRRARPYVLAVGRHVRQKGFDVLLEAFALLCERPGFDWDLVLAGDGPEHTDLAGRVQHLGIGTRVELVGATERARTAELFKGCAAFVLPSRHEPFGIVNLEAMAAARPVVASAVGGVPEFVEDGATGLLVPPEDSAALATAIGRLHEAPDLAAALGRRGRQRADAFDWVRISDQYHDVYERAARRQRKQGM
jgi:glycogen(starch) synthase